MKTSEKIEYISNWIKSYVDQMPNKAESLIIGISGGIDSSVSSTLSAMTGLKTIVLSMPIKQKENHLNKLKNRFFAIPKNLKNHNIAGPGPTGPPDRRNKMGRRAITGHQIGRMMMISIPAKTTSTNLLLGTLKS